MLLSQYQGGISVSTEKVSSCAAYFSIFPLSPTQMKSELVNDSVQEFNCSGANTVQEIKQLCNSVLPYLKLASIAQEAHRRARSYTELPEVAFTVNSTWKELETNYAQNLAQSLPQEVAVLIQAPYSM